MGSLAPRPSKRLLLSTGVKTNYHLENRDNTKPSAILPHDKARSDGNMEDQAPEQVINFITGPQSPYALSVKMSSIGCFGSMSPGATFSAKSVLQDDLAALKWGTRKRGAWKAEKRPPHACLREAATLAVPARSEMPTQGSHGALPPPRHPRSRRPGLRAPGPEPAARPPRSPAPAAACRWVRPSCRNPSRRAAHLPCRQPPAPSSRGAAGQQSTSGGAAGRSGRGGIAGAPHPGAGFRAAACRGPAAAPRRN